MTTWCVRIVGAAAVCLTHLSSLSAQPTRTVERTTARASALQDAGDGEGARRVLDSLVGVSASGTTDLAEALYWRAVLSERAGDAERDWKRLMIEAPLSPRTPDALVRLGELDMLRGRPVDARLYFTRLLRDFPTSSYRTKGLLWITRSYFEERNLASGCSTLDSLRGIEIPDGELKLQSDELRRRCLAKGSSSSIATPGTVVAPSAAPAAALPAGDTAAPTARYAVQLAAYDTRAEADAAVKRYAKRDVVARVEGEQKPYRVRTGAFATRAAATAALAKLKKRGVTGFVSERTP